MKKQILTVALLLMGIFSVFPNVAAAADVSLDDAVPIKLGALEIYPLLEVGEKHDDNILAQEKVKKSSWVTTIDPAVVAVSERGANRFEASYRLSNGYYHSSHDDDYTDHFFSANGAYNPTTRLNMSAWGGYRKTHDNRGSTFTGRVITFKTPDKYHESVVGAEVRYGARAILGVKGEYTSKRYENHRIITKTRELDTVGGGISFAVPIASKTSAVFEARYKRFNYKLLTATQNLDSTEQRYLVGLDWEATAKTTGSVRVGYLRKNFSNSRINNASQPNWELGVLWEPMSYSRWELVSSFAPLETDGTGNYTKSLSSNLTWTHEWTSYLSHQASAGYSQDTFQGLAIQRKDRIFTANVSMDYQLQRWLSVGAGYDFINRNSNAVNSSYRKNTWFFRVRGTL